MRPAITRRGLVGTGLSAGVLAAPPRRARAQAKPIRIGVLTDMSGPYAANTGPGSVLASRMAVEDFTKAQSRHQGRAAGGRHAGQAERRGQHRDRLARQRRRRPDHRPAAVLGRARGRTHGGPARQDWRSSPAPPRPRLTGQGVRAQPSALGARYLVDAARGGGCDREGRRQDLVLHHRRLHVRPLAGEAIRPALSPPAAARCWARR